MHRFTIGLATFVSTLAPAAWLAWGYPRYREAYDLFLPISVSTWAGLIVAVIAWGIGLVYVARKTNRALGDVACGLFGLVAGIVLAALILGSILATHLPTLAFVWGGLLVALAAPLASRD